MRLWVIGGDERNLHAVRAARDRGWEAALYQYQNASPPPFPAERVLLPYPKTVENGRLFAPRNPQPPRLEEIEPWIPPGAQVWTAIETENPFLKRLLAKGCRIHDPSRCEAFLEENAALTAEGALWAEMNRAGDCLWKKRCLVLGFGRIGRQLAFRLRGMGADVRIYARRKESRVQAEGLGFEAAGEEALPGSLQWAQSIFSTIPEGFLDGETMRHIENARIMDLARGVDLEAAKALNLQCVRESGLPGRYAPESAGLALFHMIEETDGA